MKRTDEQKAEIEALAKLPDDEIDTSDIPEFQFSGNAVVGKFYRPIKKSISLRLDADVLAWLQSSGPGYQVRLNRILREKMNQSVKR
jgi:uncharacterized protein (DUF4415 family)